MSDYEVVINTDSNQGQNNEFIVKLKGPPNSIYEAVSYILYFHYDV